MSAIVKATVGLNSLLRSSVSKGALSLASLLTAGGGGGGGGGTSLKSGLVAIDPVHYTYSQPFNNTIHGENIQYFNGSIWQSVPEAYRDQYGFPNAMPPGATQLALNLDTPGDNAQRTITFNDPNSRFNLLSTSGMTGVSQGTHSLTYTPQYVQADGNGGPSVKYSITAGGGFPTQFVDRKTVDPNPSALLDPQYVARNSAASGGIIRGGLFRTVKWNFVAVEGNNDPIYEGNSAAHAGITISSITRGGAGNLTATVTTSTPHNLKNRHSITKSGTTPSGFNVTDKLITVTGANTFTYPLAADPGGNATVVGTYTWGDYLFQFPRLAFPNPANEPGTLLNNAMPNAANRNRAGAGDYKIRDGVGAETKCQAATELGCGLHVNDPWNAESTYWTGDGTNSGVCSVYASFAASTGNPVAPAVTNEGWNAGYSVMHQILNEAEINGITPRQRYAQKAEAVWDYYISAFAAAGVSNLLYPTLEWQNYGSPSYFTEMLAVGSVASKCKAIAVAPYYGDNQAGSALDAAGYGFSYVGTVDATMDTLMRADIRDVVSHVAGHNAVALANNLKLICYEAGPSMTFTHTTSGVYDTSQTISRSPYQYSWAMLFLQLFERDVGFDNVLSLNWFSDAYPLGKDQRSWGLVEYGYQTRNKTNTPKWQAYKDFLDGKRELSASEGTLINIARDMPIGTSLGFLKPSAKGAAFSLTANFGGLVAINSTTGEVTIAGDVSAATLGPVTLTDRQTDARDPAGHFDTNHVIQCVAAQLKDNFNLANGSAPDAAKWIVTNAMSGVRGPIPAQGATVVDIQGNRLRIFNNAVANRANGTQSVNTINISDNPDWIYKVVSNAGITQGFSIGAGGAGTEMVFVVDDIANSTLALHRMSSADADTPLVNVGSFNGLAHPWRWLHYDKVADQWSLYYADDVTGAPGAWTQVGGAVNNSGRVNATSTKCGFWAANVFGAPANSDAGFDGFNTSL